MKVQILGSGCPNCLALEASARAAIKELSLDADVIKITDTDDIMEMGVMMTPALAIDGDVKSVGKVLTVAQVKSFLEGAA
ncbi:MAG: thioredoxin family protein [Spirochaetes bacterium]|nr:MAG: thioredoxin family protein [Spirochaetota bacterium]